MLKRLGIPGLVLGLVLGLAIGGAVSWAAIPDSGTGQITACYPTSGSDQGRLSVIDAPAGARCAPGEAALTWQQQARCVGFPHPGIDWSMPGSTPGNGCNFARTFFPPSDATNGNFTNANLTGTILSAIKVRGANFTGANLTDAEIGSGFSNVALRAAYAVTGIDLDGHNMSGWNMSNLNLSRAHLRGNLRNANLSNSKLTGASFASATLTGAIMTGVDLTNANVNAVGFTNADLRAARVVTGIHLSGIARHNPMTGWDFATLDLTGADFQYGNLTGANMTGTNLRHAHLKSANLARITWKHTTCPDNTNSNDHGNTCFGHL